MPVRLNLVVGRDERALGTIHNILAADGSVDLERRLNGNGHEPFYRFVLDPKQAWSDTCAARIPRSNVEDVRYLRETLMRCHTSMEGQTVA